MQIKIFTIPVTGGEAVNEDLNKFLRSHKILQTESHIVNSEQGAYWCFCIRYMDSSADVFGKKDKVDYRAILDEPTFARFSKLREIRKEIATEETIPAFAVFSDEELSEMAKIEKLTVAAMKKIKGIGVKKIEKYASKFISEKDDSGQQPA
ncbi:MAG: HRDC domain-containing protein [Bacteroidia bacterium]|nr:HRDC domain-containing protein [Bacteroidia bacterium]